MKSWYPATKITKKQYKYLKLLQYIFRVQNARGEWIPYILTPHQIQFHSNDIGVMLDKAISDVVVKSRNTSFTTSSIIRALMAIPLFSNQIIPFVRLNMQRAIDLIQIVKNIIQHMRPVLVNGKWYPFNPLKVNLDKATSIIFPNNVEIRAMPANAQSAEIIRGMRLRGFAGLIDEGNFMGRFKNIYIALRDASAGSKDGKKFFQMTIGTTRKGKMTNFNIWFEEMEKIEKDLKDLRILRWPVFDPTKVDLNKSLLTQNLTPIVSWHSIEDLENRRKEDLNTFQEEYMAELVDTQEQLYPTDIIMQAIDDKLDNIINKQPIEGEIYSIGVDVGATNDFFTISIFEWHTKVQRGLKYMRNIPLKDMEQILREIIIKFKPKRVVIDGNGIGYQIAQTLKIEFGNIIKIIRGTAAVKVMDKRVSNIPMKEFLHTNMLKMLNYNEVKLIPDEMQIRHYYMWKNDYTAPSTAEFGHGDIVIANGFALLPDNFEFSIINKITSATVNDKDNELIKKIDKNLDNFDSNVEVIW